MTRTATGTALGTVVLIEALIFWIGALLHLGTQIPLGFTVIAEPRIIPATIVEGLAGLLLAVGAYAIFTRQRWAWPVTIIAHIFSIAGVLLGITMLALGFGPRTELNTVYHWTILTLLVIVLIWLLSTGKAALGWGNRAAGRR
jgi:hypothetical protein